MGVNFPTPPDNGAIWTQITTEATMLAQARNVPIHAIQHPTPDELTILNQQPGSYEALHIAEVLNNEAQALEDMLTEQVRASLDNGDPTTLLATLLSLKIPNSSRSVFTVNAADQARVLAGLQAGVVDVEPPLYLQTSHLLAAFGFYGAVNNPDIVDTPQYTFTMSDSGDTQIEGARGLEITTIYSPTTVWPPSGFQLPMRYKFSRGETQPMGSQVHATFDILRRGVN